MVDELMREAWGRTYTQKDTADYIKRSIQTLAKMGNPDSSVFNADKVVPPGTVQMSGAVAAPEGLDMPPEETRADIEEHVRRLAPPAEFLQRGKELIGTQGRGGLRWPGQRSFCKVVGQSLGGLGASGAWRWLEADREARAIVASMFVDEHSLTETRLAYVAGADQLLDPRRPQRWGLLRAVADELSTHAEKSEDVHLDQATRDYHLGACWAWYLHLSPRTGIAKHPDVRPPLTWRPCARDVWGTDHLGDLVWAILRLCALTISLGTDARSDLFPPLTSRDESCPITLAGFGEGTVRAFWSLHPCAFSDMEPSTLWPHSGY